MKNIMFLTIFCTLLMTGCSSIIKKAQNNLAASLTESALNHDDPETVGAALPAYLLMLDASASKADADGDSLCSAAKLYGAYAGGFIADPTRQQRLATRALQYGTRGACALDQNFCGARDRDFDALTTLSKNVTVKQIAAISCLAGAWATDVQARADQPDAQADAPKVRVLYERIAELQPNFNQGEAQMVLGVMNSLLPPALGGKPEIGKAHFERAISESKGQNMMAKVLYAQYFARLVFEQELHDRLLNEVLNGPSEAPGLTLQNQIAKQRAKVLLESGKDFF